MTTLPNNSGGDHGPTRLSRQVLATLAARAAADDKLGEGRHDRHQARSGK